MNSNTRSTVVKCFAVLMVLALAIISSVPGRRAVHAGETINVNVLEDWLTLIAKNSMPMATGKAELVNPGQIPGIHWYSCAVQDLDFEAVENRPGGVVLRMSYSHAPALEQEIEEDLYLSPDIVARRKRQEALWLFSVKGSAYGLVRASYPSVTSHLIVQPQCSTVRLEPRGEKLELVPVVGQGVRPSRGIYYVIYNPTSKASLYYEAASGRPLPLIAAFDYKGISQDDLPTYYESIGEANGNIVVAGSRNFPRLKKGRVPRELFWHTLKPGAKTWNSIYRPLGDNALTKLLPAEFAKSGMGAPDEPVFARVAPDGEVIYRVSQVLSDGVNSLCATALIKQGPDTPPRVLVWTVRHQKVFSHNGDVSHKNTPLEMRKRTFNRVWHRGSSGAIESELGRTEPSNDLLFSVDFGNNSVIYLLNGRVWRLDLPRLPLMVPIIGAGLAARFSHSF